MKRTTTEQRTEQDDLGRPLRAITASFSFILLLLVGLVALVAVMTWLGEFKRPEIILTIILIAGVIALMCSLAAMFALLRTFGQSSGSDALGLPPGSVRAMIALMLVLVFAILSVFLYFNAAQGGIRSTGLTQEQIELLPEDRIIAIHAEPVASGAPPGTATLFSVDIAQSEVSEDLAQQLITLVGTLVTAVAAFYFGSSSVATALRGHEGTRNGGAPTTTTSPEAPLIGASTTVTTTTETVPEEVIASGAIEGSAPEGSITKTPATKTGSADIEEPDSGVG